MRLYRQAILLATLLASAVLSAALNAGLTTHTFAIQSQALDKALFEFSRQSGLQVFFASDLGEGIQAPPIKGDFGAEQALQELLANTGLDYRFSDPNTVVLYRIVTAQAAEEEPVSLREEVIVTGSHIRRTRQMHSPSPITTLERSTLMDQGNIELPEILQDLPFNSGAEVQVHNLDQPLTAGTGAINLRNLGLGATMVLLNGKRQTNVAVATTEGETFVDLNSLLPMVMIDRIEILRDGASATYGSDAVAGVVNIIPRHEFDGFSVEGRYQATGEGDQADSRVSALYGLDFADGRAHFVTAVSYLVRDRLASFDRSFTEGTAISSLGQPGTYLGGDGFTRDPACGVSGGEVSPNSEFCQFDVSGYFDLVPEEERWQWYSHLDFRVTDNSQLSASLSWNDADVWVTASPSFPFAISLPEVPVDNPGNSFGEPVLFYGRVRGEDHSASRSRSTYRHTFAALELTTDFDLFSLASSASYSQSKVRYGRADTVRDRLQSALNGEAGDSGEEYWNPLFEAENNEALESNLFSDWGMRGETELYTLDLVASTDWHAVGDYRYAVALGGHFRRETLSNSFAQVYNDKQLLALGGGPDFSSRRDIAAAFGELHLAMSEDLELQLAARYENYDRDFDALSPKVALRWQVAQNSSIRASYSRAFRAPSLFQASASQSTTRPISDDLIPGTPIFTNVITVGSSELDPETADVFNVGMTVGELANLQMDIDLWYYDYQDIIVKESAQGILERADSGDMDATNKIIRDPQTGHIVQINADFINAASVETAGVDWGLHYQWDRRAGLFTVGTAWTWTRRFDIREMPGIPERDGVGNRNVTTPAARTLPEWKGNGWLNWRRDRHQANVRVNYIDGYRDDGNGNAPVDSHTTVDLHYRLDTPLGFERVDIALGLLNAFDEDPPYVDTFLGYDAKTHDPRGRLLYLQLNYSI
ncbi:MAG: TonB-dependent receptor [Halioglobus sp.]